MIQRKIAEKTDAERRAGWGWAFLLVAVAATAVVTPMFFLGDASGHDFEFHVASWLEVARQWHQGVFYPRWAEWANWGYGEPRFIFYPPASWMMGAGLGSVLGWAVAPTAYIWLTLTGGGMAMWRLSREWLSRNESMAAAVFFAVNPYNLVLVYFRSDFAEMLALALFPLLFLCALRAGREGWKETPRLAAIFAAVWLCNAPAAVIATYSVALLLVVRCATERKLRPLLTGGAAMICGFGLVAFYIFPAAWEQRWVQIAQAVGDDLRVERNFAFAHTSQPEFLFFNLKVSLVALLTVLVTAIATVFVARRRREFPQACWPLVALGAASVFLMFSPSEIFWRFLPKLRFLQFPWRWQEAMAVVFAFFVASAWGRFRKGWMVWTAVGLLLVATAAAVGSDGWWEPDDVPSLVDAIHSQVGYEGTDEYAPVGADRYDLFGLGWQAEEPPPKPIPLATELNAAGKIVPANGVRFHVEKWTAERKVISEESEHPVDLALRLLAYPAWRARVDGQPVMIASAPEGQVLLRVPAGSHQIDLRFVRTWDRTTGDGISIFFGIVLCVWAAGLARRKD